MFSVTAVDGAARAGTLATAHGVIATPAMLLPTRRGSPLNMTPDLVAKLQPAAAAVQVDVLQLLKAPDASVLAQFPGGARQFLALNDDLALVATARDPCIYEYAGTRQQSTDAAAAVTIHTGGLAVSPAAYMEAAAALAPDLLVALCDEVPADAKRERAAAAVDRSLAWLRACLGAAAAAPALARCGVLAPVAGARHLEERARSAAAVAALNGPAGYAICGLGTGESPEERRAVLEAAIAPLSPGLPRLASTVGAPEEVLEAVTQGVDLFDMAYVAEATAGGYAMSFPFPLKDDSSSVPAGSDGGPAGAAEHASAAGASGGGSGLAGRADGGGGCEDASKINLWGLAYREDGRPPVPGCACYTCRTHSRAYVHHLLHTHEMTAQVLLEVHNTHHYLAFFAAIRESIAAGAFAGFRQSFLERRQRLLLQAV
eukprot:scaffold2.g7224.t1